MKHLLVCPEYRPAPIPPGGIGTYVGHIARLMAEAGETVHVVGVLWEGAPRAVEEQMGGRLIIHRVPLDEPRPSRGRPYATAHGEIRGLQTQTYRPQRFALQSAALIERLVLEEDIDVIESQEYDAPLYVFQLRRALGLGPERTPPCIVQLHSPSEFIVRHNEWDPARPDFQLAKRMEDFSIGTADALLCPSRFLAAQAERHYGLPEGAITVVRLPIGETPEQERSAAVWENDAICYVGRLEPRKGVIEWVDAAVAVADGHPRVRFDFLGADLSYTADRTVKQHLLDRIPRRLRDRFVFHGSRPREAVMAALRESCAAAVPSRWENFPNTCIEAMCTGIPVIATREGGMAEMIEDGRSGWLAESADPVGLADALRRALSTPAPERAAMGKAASLRIRTICDNATTLEAHLDFRRRVVEEGACRSRALPPTLPWARQRLDARCARPSAAASGAHEESGPSVAYKGSPSVGIVVTCRADGALLDDALSRARAQRPAASLLVVDVTADGSVADAAARARGAGWTVLEVETLGRGTPALRNAGACRVLRERPELGALLFLDERDRIGDRLLLLANRVLQSRPEVGVVAPWTQDAGSGSVKASLPPAFPYQIVADDSTPASLFRTAALEDIDFFDEALPAGYDRWDAVSRIMTRGWVAVTLPELLAQREGCIDGMEEVGPARARLRSRMLGKLTLETARDADEIVLLLESRALEANGAGAGVPLTPRRVLRLPLSQQMRIAARAARHPGKAARWFGWHLTKTLGSGRSRPRRGRARAT
jgi:glycogen synthase